MDMLSTYHYTQVTSVGALRRLAGIAAIDVAGYLLLMGIDEQRKLDDPKAHRAAITASRQAEEEGTR